MSEIEKTLPKLCWIGIWSLILPLLQVEEREVQVMYYRLVSKTASGELTTSIKEPFVAVSRDLLEVYPMQSKILLYHCEWEGIYTVKDTMGKRHSNTIDVFTTSPRARNQKCKCKLIE